MENTQMQAAMQAAGLIDHQSLPTPFASEQVANRVGFTLSANFGKAATRIQKLANPPKGSTPESLAEIKAELKECILALAWGIDNIPSAMRDIDEAIAEWCGGGYSKPATDSDLEQVAGFLGVSKEAAKATAEANRSNRTAYLTIRRQGLAPIMVGQITNLLSQIDDSSSGEPSADVIAKACTATFQSAVLWGNWAEAALAKADMVYHCGKSPDMPGLDTEMNRKAEMIRDRLAEAQAAQAQRDAEALRNFDIDLAA